MKLFNKLLASVLILGMTACSSDEPAVGGGENGGKGAFYSSLKFSFPKARSEQKEGEEIGQDYENKVGSILVIMATESTSGAYEFVSYALNDAPINTTAATDPTYTITFNDRTQLLEHAGQSVSIFAVCNPTAEIHTKVEALTAGDTFTDEIFTATPEDTWQQNGFLMTNVEILTNTLPSAEVLKSTYNTPGNPYKLGTIKVIRTMARFDFRDASANKDLTYEIKNNETDEVQGSVKLTRVAMFNQADRFYYFPRTQAAAGADFTICPTFDGMEDGFVLSPAGRNYTENIPMVIDPLNTAATGLKWASLNTILGNNEDKDEGWGENVAPADKLGYHIWRYTTENTFGPGEELDIQKVTGYVFEAEIIVDADFGNVNEDGSFETMYLYGQTLYASPAKIAEAIANIPVSTLATAFEAAFTKNADGSYTAKSDEEVKAAGFIAYKPSTDGKYFCYYFSYNRHNDNGKPEVVGDMEFATVRNNVYKLAVTKITKFGKFEPEPEIEDWDVYFDLDVQVMPWVVRINNIEY